MTTTASLNYLKPMADGIKSYTYVDPPPEGTPWTNAVEDPHRMTITDVRSLPPHERPTLEENGAQFVFDEHAGQGKERNWDDDDEVKTGYYAEVEAVLKKATGPARIVIFDHTIRRPAKEGEDDNPKNRHPIPRVHIDQTYQAGIKRLQKHLSPEELTDALAYRSQLINVWRPIAHTVEDVPLAIADANSVKDEDKVASDVISNAYPNGETFRVHHNPNHRWLYLAHQTPREYVLIKCFDSTRPDKIVPHTAFINEDAKEGAPSRQSIEVRCLVLYDE